MKHVEQIKSIVLFLLVSLSLILTFSIWSYTPDYKTIEESQAEPIKVGTKKELHEVLKPHRILAHENGRFSGTTSSTLIEGIMESMTSLAATEVRFIKKNLTEAEINRLVHSENRMTMFYSDEVPIDTFSSILELTQYELDEDPTFSHLLIDWSNVDQSNTLQLQFSFISEEKRTHYTTDVIIGTKQFESTLMEALQNSVAYTEIGRNNELSLYVPVDPVNLEKYTYSIDEISPEKFKNILFKDVNRVKKNIESKTSTIYTDSIARMIADDGTKKISYVYAPSESFSKIKESELLQDSLDFVNEHGGLDGGRGDYRYLHRDAPKHEVVYQLFLQGIPVFSNITWTTITTTWGENQIFSYKRPYYRLKYVDSEASTLQLQSGIEVVESLKSLEDIELEDIDDIVLGYFLTQDSSQSAYYTLEPAWFIIRDGGGIRLTTSESIGGTDNGLE